MKTPRITKSILFTLLSTHTTAIASGYVDLRDAGYTGEWVDVVLPNEDLKISRLYKSRSMNDGIFGYGWCSDIETKLEAMQAGRLRIRSCSDGGEAEFVSQTTSASESRRVPPTKTPVSKTGVLFLAQGRPNESVYLKDGTFTWFRSNGSQFKFNQRGRLFEMRSIKQQRTTLLYNPRGRIKEMVGPRGSRLRFEVDPANGKLLNIVGDSIFVSYRYDGENLSRTSISGIGSYTYLYDDLHNLLRADFPDKSFLTLAYDKDRDWVRVFRDRGGCFETYTYRLMSNDVDHQQSEGIRHCEKNEVSRARYDFWHKRLPNGRRALARMRLEKNGITSDTTYDTTTGQPLRAPPTGQFAQSSIEQRQREVRGPSNILMTAPVKENK